MERKPLNALLLLLIGLLLFTGCGQNRIDTARFEIEQGNFKRARALLKAVPENSPDRSSADSLLKIIEKRMTR